MVLHGDWPVKTGLFFNHFMDRFLPKGRINQFSNDPDLSTFSSDQFVGTG
jgi:hypothetical protein